MSEPPDSRAYKSEFSIEKMLKRKKQQKDAQSQLNLLKQAMETDITKNDDDEDYIPMRPTKVTRVTPLDEDDFEHHNRDEVLYVFEKKKLVKFPSIAGVSSEVALMRFLLTVQPSGIDKELTMELAQAMILSDASFVIDRIKNILSRVEPQPVSAFDRFLFDVGFGQEEEKVKKSASKVEEELTCKQNIAALFQVLTEHALRLANQQNAEQALRLVLIASLDPRVKTILSKLHSCSLRLIEFIQQHENVLKELLESIPQDSWYLLLQSLPSSIIFKQKCAWMMFCLSVHAKPIDIQAIYALPRDSIVDELTQLLSPAFEVNQETDYIAMKDQLMFIWHCVKVSDNHASIWKQILASLVTVQSRIQDRKAAHLERTAVKDLLLRFDEKFLRKPDVAAI